MPDLNVPVECITVGLRWLLLTEVERSVKACPVETVCLVALAVAFLIVDEVVLTADVLDAVPDATLTADVLPAVDDDAVTTLPLLVAPLPAVPPLVDTLLVNTLSESVCLRGPRHTSSLSGAI